MHSICPVEIFEEKRHFWKTNNFEVILQHRAEKFWHVYQNYILSVWENLLQKYMFFELEASFCGFSANFFSEFSRNFFELLVKNLQHGCQECILILESNFSKMKIYSEKNIFFILKSSDFMRRFFWFLAKIFCRIVRSAFYISRETFSGNTN